MSNLIPGTPLVRVEPGGASSGEGRGVLDNLRQGHVGPELSSGEHDTIPGLTVDEMNRVGLALRALAGRGLREERPSFEQIGVQTDANGRAVQQLHIVPAGWESEVTYFSVDIPSSSAIHWSAPYAAATAFAFLAILGAGSGPQGGALTAPSLQALRAGSFKGWPSPASTTGPILPVDAFWSDDNAPIVFGGEAVYYVLQGTAAIANQQLVVNIGMMHRGPTAVA